MTIYTGVDNEIHIYINGVNIFNASAHGFTYRWEYTFDIPKGYINPGRNVIAVQAVDWGGATGFDLKAIAEVNIPPMGSMAISSVPSEAKIYSDGMDTGKLTPAVLTNLSTGSHQIVLTKPLYNNWAETVTVSSGQTTEIDVPLRLSPTIIITPISGTVGIIITVTGENFSPIEAIRIDFGLISSITIATTTAYGTFATTFTVSSQPAGTTTIVATGLTSGSKAYATFTLTTPPQATLTVRLDQIDAAKFPTIECHVRVTQGTTSIAGLTADNFQLTEQSELESIPTVEIISVSATNTGGVAIAQVLDRSGSMQGQKITDAKTAANSLVDMMQPLDRMAIVSFASNVTVDQSFTSNQSALHTAINNLVADGGTALYDGIYMGIGQCTQEIGVKAVIALTDGQENSSSHTQQQVIDYAIASAVPVYTIGLGGDVDAGILTHIATSTGGTYHFSPNSTQLQEIFADIREEIEQQYLVTYNTHNPNYDGTLRNVVITASYNSAIGSDSGTYRVDEPPKIIRTPETIALGSQSQPANQPLTIAATITDNTAVTNATLFYRHSGTLTSYSQLTMTHIGNNLYKTTIPAASVNYPGVDYYITASDGRLVASDPKNNPETYPYQIAVYPNEKPVIIHTPVSGALINSSVTITAYATDTTDYITSVTLSYRIKGYVLYENVVMTKAGNTYTATIPANKMTFAGVEYYIVAMDNYGLRAYHGTDVNPHYIRPNVPPSITITAPPAQGAYATSSYTIAWVDADPDNDAQISLYYDTNNTGYDGSTITTGLSEDSSINSYIWDISTIPEGSYYIYAKIDDGTNTPVYDYSNGPLNIDHSLPRATITTTPASPITATGTVYVILTASEKLSAVSLTFTPYGKSPISIPLTTTDYITWQGNFQVTLYTGDGIGTFNYTLKDLFGVAFPGSQTLEIDVAGVIFTQSNYSFNVEKDYNQQGLVKVKNIDNEAHQFSAQTLNVPEGIAVDFIGDGSVDSPITLQPGEERNLILSIHTQYATKTNYSLQGTLTNDEGLISHTTININVRLPEVRFTVSLISEDPMTLAKTYRITNIGADPIPDLTIDLGTLTDKVIMHPLLYTIYLGTQSYVEFKLVPIINETFTGLSGTWSVSSGDKVVEVLTTWQVTGTIYKVTLNQPKLVFDISYLYQYQEGYYVWVQYCPNQPPRRVWVADPRLIKSIDPFYIPTGFGTANVQSANLSMHFSQGNIQANRDTYIYINNNEVGRLLNVNPEGYYTFPVVPEYFLYPDPYVGNRRNEINMETNINTGHLAWVGNFRVTILLDKFEVYVIATSSAAATTTAWALPYVHHNSEQLFVNITQPPAGFEYKKGTKVLIKAEVKDEHDLFQWLCNVQASFTNSTSTLNLYDDGMHNDAGVNDGIYANYWYPVSEGTVTITVVASNCKTQATDTVTGTIIGNRAPTVDILTPTELQTLQGTTTISYQATDPDGDSLYFYIYYSASSIGPWNLFYIGVNTAYLWNTNILENGIYYIRVVASDPSGLTGSDTVKVTVKNKKPKIRVNPTAGSQCALVTVYGEDFGATETVQIDFGLHLNITTGMTNAEGSFTTYFTVDTQAVGTISVVATGINSHLRASADFTITAIHYIKGYIRYANGEGIPGIKVYLMSPIVNDCYITSADGYYEFNNLPTGYYRTRPFKEWYTFEPPGREYYPVLNASYDNQNYIGTPQRYYIKGRCKTEADEGIGGVQVVLSGSVQATYTTNASGYYAFWDVPGGTYTITPYRQFYTFVPANRILPNIDFHQAGQDFVGTSTTVERYYIKGTITDMSHNPLAGVRVYLLGTMDNVFITRADGYYEFSNLVPGYYRTSPWKQGYTFRPSGKRYEYLCSHYEHQDFDDDGPPQGIQPPPPTSTLTSLFFVVKDNAGKGIAGAQITLTPLNVENVVRVFRPVGENASKDAHYRPVSAGIITDADGMADIIKPISELYGHYKIEVAKPGYNCEAQMITITEETIALDIPLLLQPIILLPTVNKLYQNYPNPFNPNQEETQISYDLAVNAHIVIKIYNIAGELVRTLEEDKLAGSNITTLWNGRNDDGDIVSSGVYFYQLHIGGSVVGTKKILVIK
ncbi:MAG: VWA domain-containing protein [bacterium]